ncbi:hypothetical protein FRC10_002297, partial [Ceratobasidium sp. 414]
RDHGWVRLRSAVTGQAHSQAKHPLLSVKLGFSIPFVSRLLPNVAVKTKNDLIAAKFTPGARHVYEILIWDWKTGRLLNRTSCDRGTGDFVFLDKDRLAVWSTNGSYPQTSANLLIFEQIGTAGFGPDVPDGSVSDIASLPKLAPASTFNFPKLKDSSSIKSVRFSIGSDYDSGVNLTQSTPFVNSRSLTLGLKMHLILGMTVFPLIIFVDTYRLLRYVEQLKGRSISILSWEEWGEHTTRWFRAPGNHRQTSWMIGSRFTLGSRHLSVIDFHTPTVQRHKNRRRDTYVPPDQAVSERFDRRKLIADGEYPGALKYRDVDSRLIQESSSTATVVVDTVTSEEPTKLPYFDELVVSRLPYRSITRLFAAPTDGGWIISGNHLVWV